MKIFNIPDPKDVSVVREKGHPWGPNGPGNEVNPFELGDMFGAASIQWNDKLDTYVMVQAFEVQRFGVIDDKRTDPAGVARMRLSDSPASSDEALHAQLRTSWLRSNPIGKDTVFTNQYAVTEPSQAVAERAVPGIFVKYDMEPILLTIAEEWDTPLALLVRLVNVVAGILVAGGWLFQVASWAREVLLRRGRRRDSYGVLHGRTSSLEEKRGF